MENTHNFKEAVGSKNEASYMQKGLKYVYQNCLKKQVHAGQRQTPPHSSHRPLPQPTGSITRHASASTAPPDSAAADPRRLQLPPAPPRPPHLPHRRRQVLWPPHHGQGDPREQGRLLHRRRERAVGIRVQVLHHGEGELRAALPLA